MNNNKMVLSLLTTVLLVTAGYCQDMPKSQQAISISGKVTAIDSVANTISIMTDDQHQMSFFVPNNASIVRDTHVIGLMDIGEDHPVTIQYDISSPGQDVAKSIVDNKPSDHE